MMCAAYAALALAALIGTQLAVLGFIRESDNGGLTGFLDVAFANPATTFMSLDATFVAVTALVFMLAEGWRIGMRRLWVYVLLTFGLAISVALPVFLLVRQLHLAPVRSRPLTEQ
jgi:hypothetical protein